MTATNPDFIARLYYLTPEQGGRKTPALSGYRPHIKFDFDAMQTNGQQVFIGQNAVNPGETVLAAITIAARSRFKHKLSVGTVFQFREGSTLIGTGEITEICNPKLAKKTEIEMHRALMSDTLMLEQAEEQVRHYMAASKYIPELPSWKKLLLKREKTYQEWENDRLSPFSSIPIKAFKVVEKVINQHITDLYGNYDGIKAKEEDMSAVLADKITDSLLGELKHQFDDAIIGDYTFRITTHKKQKQESKTGADLFGVCTMNYGGYVVNKYFLIQSKIAIRRENGTVYTKDDRILDQAISMSRISPASFFLLYTESGFEVVSALNIVSQGVAEIDTALIHSRPFEEFNNLILECFIGDNRCELEAWKNYINDPKNHPIPDEESLLHIRINKLKPDQV